MLGPSSNPHERVVPLRRSVSRCANGGFQHSPRTRYGYYTGLRPEDFLSLAMSDHQKRYRHTEGIGWLLEELHRAQAPTGAEEDQSEAAFPLRVPFPQCRASPQVEGLRHPKQRNDALSRLKPADPELTSAVGSLKHCCAARSRRPLSTMFTRWRRCLRRFRRC
jgi:hypothetical protein